MSVSLLEYGRCSWVTVNEVNSNILRGGFVYVQWKLIVKQREIGYNMGNRSEGL